MNRSDDRILVTHAGSLIRPKALRQKIGMRLANALKDDRAYQECLRQSVSDIVREQIAAGIDSVSDGEFGKIGWSIYVAERLGGLTAAPTR